MKCVFGCIGILSLLSAYGCAGIHLHSDADYTLAKGASAAFKDANLTNSVADERKLMADILTRELQVVHDNTLARRDATLMSVVDGRSVESSWQNLGKSIDNRWTDLVGATNDANTLVQTLATLETDQSGLQAAADDYYDTTRANKAAKAPPLQWPIPEAATHPENFSPQFIKTVYDRWRDRKQTVVADLQAIQKYPLGDFGLLNTTIMQIQSADNAINTQLDTIKAEYNQKQKEYEAAVASQDGERIKKAAAGIRDGILQLEGEVQIPQDLQHFLESNGLKDLQLQGKLAALDEKLKAIDSVLETLSTGTAPADSPATAGPKTKTALAILAQIPSLADEIGDAIHYPHLASLTLESEHLRLLEQEINAKISRNQERISMLTQQRDAMGREVMYLASARQAFGRLKIGGMLDAEHNDPAVKQAASGKIPESATAPYSLAVTFSKTAPDVREDVSRALILYGDSWTVCRTKEEELDYRLIANQHDAAIDATEAAYLQWNNCIGVPLAQLEAYHASGIKPEDIANLIQAAGFAAVGVGVNK
jgi:hypothetical protein